MSENVDINDDTFMAKAIYWIGMIIIVMGSIALVAKKDMSSPNQPLFGNSNTRIGTK